MVAIQDAGSNGRTTSSASVALTLTCAANPKSTSSEVVTFSGCSKNTAGTDTLIAAAGGLTNAIGASLTSQAADEKPVDVCSDVRSSRWSY